MNKPSIQQVNFINTLQFERKVPQALINLMHGMWNSGQFSDKSADDYIKVLLELPADSEKQVRNQALVGYHSFQDNVYQVHRSKNGHMYVKRLTFDENGKAKMVYANFGIMKNFNESTRLHRQAITNVENLLKR